MADHYAGKPLENRRSQKSSKASEKTYTPRSRASQQAQFAKEMEDSGAKWAAKKGKGKVLPKAVAVASKRAREDTDSDSSSSQSDSYNSSDSSSSDSDTPAMAPQKAAPKTVLKVKAWVLPPASAPPGPSKHFLFTEKLLDITPPPTPSIHCNIPPKCTATYTEV
eukprot:GILI01000180.1.p1 GENE.GILI01000180.1~~GILI01000180.1.p1  ORF type:complete len:165 (+),score=4.22 GILI01000180.1:2-496(+)